MYSDIFKRINREEINKGRKHNIKYVKQELPQKKDGGKEKLKIYGKVRLCR